MSRRVLIFLTLTLALAACEHMFVRGSASEHGIENFKVGLPL